MSMEGTTSLGNHAEKMDLSCLICALEWNNERKLLPIQINNVKNNALKWKRMVPEQSRLFSKIF